jgi:DNA-binding NarL/FixJ family response regulator
VQSESDRRSTSPLVLVVDDDFFFREGLVSFLKRNGFEVIEAADVLSAHAVAVQRRPDVAIVDIVLPPTPGGPRRSDDNLGVDLIRLLKGDLPLLAAILISGFPDRSQAVLSLALAGIHGLAYIVKGQDGGREVLLQAIEETQAGHVVIRAGDAEVAPMLSRTLRGQLLPEEQALVDRAKGLFAGLSSREKEIAFLLAHAKTPAAVAAQLSISQATVERHITNLYSKLELDRADDLKPPLRKAVLLARVCWLVDLENK